MSTAESDQAPGEAYLELPEWLRDERRQRLLLGDWNPIVRDPIDVLRWALLLACGLLVIFDKNLQAAPLASVLIVLVPRLLDMPRLFDLLVILAMSLHAWGNLFDFFDSYEWYDDVVHFLVPMLTCSSTYILLARFEVVLDPADKHLRRQELGVFLITFLIGLGFAALYEVYEAGVDAIFGTKLQDSLADTNTDLLFGVLGSAVGGFLLVVWARRGWATTRRVAGEELIRWYRAGHRALPAGGQSS